MEHNGDNDKARKRLIKINELIETLVIDGYGENGLNVNINSIISYIYFRLYHEEGITMLDIEGLTGRNPYLTPEAEDDIIYMYGEDRGIKRIDRINNFLRVLFEHTTSHILNAAQQDPELAPEPANEVKLTPYDPSGQSHAAQQEGHQCTICFANEDDEDATQHKTLVSTPCNHIFHSACIKEWFKTHSTCPLCRRAF